MDVVLGESARAADREAMRHALGLDRPLAERWALLTRADYSNGDSEGIWQVQAVFRYGIGSDQQYGLMFGYRYKKAKYEYDNIEEDNEYYGPLIGFNFRF